jgi:hypothetical protein
MDATKEHVHDLEQSVSVTTRGLAAIRLEPAPIKANIGPFSIIALAFNVNNSWTGLSSSLQIALI